MYGKHNLHYSILRYSNMIKLSEARVFGIINIFDFTLP